MRLTARNALVVILFSVLCAGCGTSNTVVLPKASIEYHPQDDPETQLQCPEPPPAPDPETATDRVTGKYIVALRTGYGTCYRSVKSYKQFRKGVANVTPAGK